MTILGVSTIMTEMSLILVRLKIVDIQKSKHYGVKADHVRDFHHLGDDMTKL